MGGSCITGVNSYSCVCHVDYSGPNCEVKRSIGGHSYSPINAPLVGLSESTSDDHVYFTNVSFVYYHVSHAVYIIFAGIFYYGSNQLNGKEYGISDVGNWANYRDAYWYCFVDGADLVSISSTEEAHLVDQLIQAEQPQ